MAAGTSVVATGQQLHGRIIGCSADIRLAIRSTLLSGSRRRCDRTVGGARTFVRRDACAFSIVPPASRCGPGSGVLSRSCQEGARRKRIDPNYTPIRQQIIVVGDQRPFRRCAQRCEFSIVRSRTRTKALGSTGPLNSPSGWKRLATFSQSRRRIRRRIISISLRVDWFQIK